MKMTFKVVAFVFLPLALIACERYEPLRNIDNQPIVYNMPLHDVETAILKAGVETGWVMTVEKPGLINALLNIRIHRATVSITYNEKTYSIDYKDSMNLLDESGNIHKNYNLWVDALDQRIKYNLIEGRPK